MLVQVIVGTFYLILYPEKLYATAQLTVKFLFHE
jgi:hypothetical protein